MGFRIYFTEDKTEYYDSDACELRFSSGKPIKLSSNSRTIFEYLTEYRNKVKTREEIHANLYDIDPRDAVVGRSVDTAINSLRNKLGKYRDCIDTVTGVGYKYIGPPKESEHQAVPPAAPPASETPAHAPEALTTAQRRSIPRSELQRMVIRPWMTEPASQSDLVMANLQSALNRLVDAEDEAQTDRVGFLLKSAIEDFVIAIANESDFYVFEDDTGAGWARETKNYRRWLLRAVEHYGNEIKRLNQDETLLGIKLRLLDYIYSLHFIVELLGAQLSLEQEALEMSGNAIGKETRQSRIYSLEKDHRFASDEARAAYAEIQGMIDAYARSRSTERPTI